MDFTNRSESNQNNNSKVFKIRKKFLFVILAIIVVVIGIIIFISSNNGMSSLDREFDGYAKKAAEQLIQEEVEDYSSFTSIKSSKPEYLFTLYNKEQDLYEVSYIAEFNDISEPEPQWIIVEVTLNGDDKSVYDVSSGFCGPDYYEMLLSMLEEPFSRSSGGETWYDINLSDEEIESIGHEKSNY